MCSAVAYAVRVPTGPRRVFRTVLWEDSTVQEGQLHLWGSGKPRTTAPMQRKTMILDREKHWFLLPDKPFEDLLGLEDWITVGTTFGLTARELDVVILLFEDCTRQTMCRRLRRGAASIRKRIDRVFRK